MKKYVILFLAANPVGTTALKPLCANVA